MVGFARRAANPTVFRHKGRIREAGPCRELFARELFESPKTPEMAQFIKADIK